MICYLQLKFKPFLKCVNEVKHSHKMSQQFISKVLNDPLTNKNLDYILSTAK